MSGRDGVPTLLYVFRMASLTLEVEFPDHPVEKLFDDDRSDVEETAMERHGVTHVIAVH